MGLAMKDEGQRQARKRRIRNRNWALLAVLVALFVLFYLVTIVRFGGGDM